VIGKIAVKRCKNLALGEAEVDALSREADVTRDALRINYTYRPITNEGVRP
jgi:hypothetical protein